MMGAIMLAVLNILLLLLRAHFSQNSDQEKAMNAIRAAQAKLSDLAAQFEQKIRFTSPPESGVEHIQDGLDEERKKGK